jgi:hypothetical protein
MLALVFFATTPPPIPSLGLGLLLPAGFCLFGDDACLVWAMHVDGLGSEGGGMNMSVVRL